MLFKHKRTLAEVIAATVLVVVAFGIGSVVAAVRAYPPLPTKPDIYDLWSLTNQERLSHGLKPLVLDPALDKSASAKCSDMVRLNYWDHNLPDGTNPETFIKANVSYRYVIWGENLAYGYPTASKTMNGWMGSPEHRANILKPDYTNVGFAVCSDTANPNMVVQHLTAE